MKKLNLLLLPIMLISPYIGLSDTQSSSSNTWHSSLYPADWQPGYTDEGGHFLHDFSYSGYHYGKELPAKTEGIVVDITDDPYNADPSGKTDSTQSIQKALDAVGRAGGGVVYMPEGSYRIAPYGDMKAALHLGYNGVVMHGAGMNKTFLFNDSYAMREKTIIDVSPAETTSWNADGKDYPGITITQDLPNPVSQIPLDSIENLQIGDAIVIRNDLTQHYIDHVGMNGKWTPAQSRNRTLTYYRRITDIQPDSKVISIDIPTRGHLYMADNARVVPISGHMLQEVGLEDFSIGNVQHPGEGLDWDDYAKPGTLGYEVHNSVAIYYSHVENGWLKRIGTYAPEGNPENIHILSHCLKLDRCRNVTVAECDLRHTQYKGNGGNGYLYMIHGQDNLVKDCRAEDGRHNYSFGTMSCSGNVIVGCLAKDGALASDFHMFLSLANLIDNMTCDGDFLEAREYRPWGVPVHGVTTTESVFWNTNGMQYPPNKYFIIFSHQYNDGYVIGTRGPAYMVNTSDFVEGIGKGDTLEPKSLYYDQLNRRLDGTAQAKGIN